MCVYLRTKFQVSSIILTSFKQVILPPPTPPQNEALKSPPRLGLMRLHSLIHGNKNYPYKDFPNYANQDRNKQVSRKKANILT